MISRIQHIKDFGVFSNFQWPGSLPEFKQYNLIYGWNYSGKTTLTRALRCFEHHLMHKDFPQAKVQLNGKDGRIHQLSTPGVYPTFRVFNSDFVQMAVNFVDGSAAPILILGAANMEKETELKSKKAVRDELLGSIETNRQIKREKQSAIDDALTRYARDFIKVPLAEVNYDRRRFEPKVSECRTKPEQYLLEEDELGRLLDAYRSDDEKPALTLKTMTLSAVSPLSDLVLSIVSRTVNAANSIARLKENSAIETWVNEGRQLHEGIDVCQFCGQKLPDDLLSHLSAHFSSEYDDLMTNLDSIKQQIETALEENLELDHKSDFYKEFAKRFSAEKEKLDGLIAKRTKALGILVGVLEQKKTKAFTNISCPVVEDPTQQIALTIEKLNAIITEHNDKTAQFETTRAANFLKLEKHYAAKFIQDEKYESLTGEIAKLGGLIEVEESRKQGLDNEIRILERKLSEAARGAERINELLAAYFGKRDLEVVVSADKRFQISRKGVVAKNLSEGEKSALAFAYFITCVQDGRVPMHDTRVVIDDPISSLDANHVFNTYALIKTQLANCRQLFILTHNFDFYSLVREWVDEDEGSRLKVKPQVEWKKWGIYLVRRTDTDEANLEEIPKELLIFKSEYHYLFSILYKFSQSNGNNFDGLITLPNVVRRFLEAFGGIMIPVSTGLKSKMERLFPDSVTRERVWKYINHYSHNTTITRSLAIPDAGECKAVVDACLKAVEAWDSDYLRDLIAEVR